MKKLILLLLIANFFMAASAKADDIYVHGEDLLVACNEAIKYLDKTGDSDAFNSGRCWGYIAGATDMHELMDKGVDAHHSCKPRGKDISELAKAIVKYLRNHPEKIQLPATLLIYDAYNEAFPCDENINN